MTYYAYTSRSGNLIVTKYLGEQVRQETRKVVRREIGIYWASDIEAARRIALDLTNRTYA